jgi:hypothetical protein
MVEDLTVKFKMRIYIERHIGLVSVHESMGSWNFAAARED